MTLHALTAPVKQRPAHFVSFIPYRWANSNHIISLYIVQHATLKYESSSKNNHKIISECKKKKKIKLWLQFGLLKSGSKTLHLVDMLLGLLVQNNSFSLS